MATELTPQTDVTSGEAYRRKKKIKNPIKLFFPIKSDTSDSFVNHFDGHFAYLKTLDFYFNALLLKRTRRTVRAATMVNASDVRLLFTLIVRQTRHDGRIRWLPSTVMVRQTPH